MHAGNLPGTSTILVVEDDRDLAQLFSVLLAEVGFDCQTARSGREALAYIQQSRPRLMLLDYSLPDMLADVLIESAAENMPPFIVVTGQGDERTAVAMMKRGAHDYLVKDSLLFERLVPTVRHVLQEVEMERRLAEAEAALRASREELMLVADHAPVTISHIDADKRYMYVNQRLASALGLPRESVLGRRMQDVIDGETFAKILPYVEMALSGQPVSFEVEYRGVQGQTLIAQASYVPYEDRGMARSFFSFVEDVTERKAREEKERWEASVTSALSELYRPLLAPDAPIDEIPFMVVECGCALTGSMDGFVSLIDPHTGDATLYALKRALDGSPTPSSRSQVVFPRRQDGGYPGLLGYALETRQEFYTNTPAAHPSAGDLSEGDVDIQRLMCMPVMMGQDLVGHIALANPSRDYGERDLEALRRLTEFYALAIQRKRSEDRLKASLAEKEVLLKEIHHRVKNNLQVISSLISLQAGYIQDPLALEAFRESQSRVKSMALIHERLYESTDLARIDFSGYVTGLVQDLSRSYWSRPDKLSLAVNVQDAFFAVDTAIPCGLIINELVSNCFKHAFPGHWGGRPEGECRVSVDLYARDGCWTLIVADNGVGVPPQLDLQNVESLGLRLVVTLTDQLGGKLELDTSHGTAFKIAFAALR